MYTFLLFLIIVGASSHLTHFVTTDQLTHRFRHWVGNLTGGKIRLYSLDDPGEWRWFMLSCPWCIGTWISGAVTYAAYISEGYNWFGADWYTVPATALTVAYLVGFIAGKED